MKNEYLVFPHPSLDWRLSPDRHTNVRMPAKHFTSVEEVEKRREELRFNLRMAAGLYPWPEKTPLNVRTPSRRSCTRATPGCGPRAICICPAP